LHELQALSSGSAACDTGKIPHSRTVWREMTLPGTRAGPRKVLFIAVGVAMTAVSVFLFQIDALGRQELQTVDKRFQLRGAQAAPADLVLVEIDDRTFARLHHRFPFPRSWHAAVIDRLRRDGARVIAYDVQFSEESGRTKADISEDDKLINAIRRASGKIVLSTTDVDPRNGHTNLLGGDDKLRQYGARAGNAAFPDGKVVRQEPFAVDRL
jgi:adenylate cyclase